MAVVSHLRKIGGRSKLESTVYSCGLSRQTPDRLLALAGVLINWDDLSEFVHRQINTEDRILHHRLFNSLLLHLA